MSSAFEMDQPNIKEFIGMSQSDVADFLQAFPAKKEMAKRLEPLSIELNSLIINSNIKIGVAISILDALRVGDLKGAIRMYQIDGDKLHTYSKITQWINEKLLPLNGVS